MNSSDILKNISYLRSFVKVNSISNDVINRLNQNKNLKIIYVESVYVDGEFTYVKKIYDGNFSILVETINSDIFDMTIYFDVKDINVVEIFIKQLIK